MSCESRRRDLDLMFRGYTTIGECLEMTDALHDVCKMLVGVEEPMFCRGYDVRVDDIVNLTRTAMSKFYRLHDIDYCGCCDIEYIFDEIKDIIAGLKDDPNYTELFKLIDFMVEKKNPFEIPIEMTYFENPFNGELINSIVGAPSMDFADKSRIVFSGITLDWGLSNMSIPIYAHEITHSQVDSVRGACGNYQNMEVLSIFNEKLMALEIDPSLELLRKLETCRAYSLVNNFIVLNYKDEFEDDVVLRSSMYITSALQANHLFDRYLNGNDDEKQSIIDGIQRVFDGESTVEELLDNNHVNVKNSCDVQLIKKHI